MAWISGNIQRYRVHTSIICILKRLFTYHIEAHLEKNCRCFSQRIAFHCNVKSSNELVFRLGTLNQTIEWPNDGFRFILNEKHNNNNHAGYDETHLS